MLWLTVDTLSDIYDVPPPSLLPRYVITFLVCHFPLSLSFLDTFLILILLMCLVLRCITNTGERGRKSKRKTERRSQTRRTQATVYVFYNTKQMLIPMNGMFVRGNGAAMTHWRWGGAVNDPPTSDVNISHHITSCSKLRSVRLHVGVCEAQKKQQSREGSKIKWNKMTDRAEQTIASIIYNHAGTRKVSRSRRHRSLESEIKD